jgi:alkylhydroperoxidase family enzyme
LRRDYTQAPISQQDRAMLDYVVKLTTDATKCSRDDHDRLRAVGFDDRGILQITLIASWFIYINRVADALGVGRDWGIDQLIRQPTEREIAPAVSKS